MATPKTEIAMTEHTASVHWMRRNHPFTYEGFSRDHSVGFENGQVALASAAPGYLGNGEALNPETLLLGALASCHMLTFLAVAAKRGYVVESYADQAIGTLARNIEGKIAITRVRLQPKIVFSGEKIPDDAELARLHARAHDNCFIANSIRSEVSIG